MSNSQDDSRKAEVLRQLDAAQEDYSLLSPGNSNYPDAAMRLIAYVSETDWLLTIQLVAWGKAEAQFVRFVQVFGNRLEEPGELFPSEVVAAAGETPLFIEGKLQADLFDYEVTIGGSPQHFSYSAEDYAEAGIDLEETPRELAFIRLLAARHPDQLLLDEDAVLAAVDQPGLHPVLRLSDWVHPDPGEDELPSELPCFVAIADSIALGKATDLDSCGGG
ncbi:DUF7003 family protein [Fodinicola acaciae]|uniref:DUF7003 family protein n=1 Tax=Fodinicola acaciae TaxID=2681555 RepID=UPI0013D86679|nr:hypothetical protein [Fodinicola acaciae]